MHLRNFIILTVSLVLAACSSNSDEPGSMDPADRLIRFSTSCASRDGLPALSTSYNMYVSSIFHGRGGNKYFLQEEPVTYNSILGLWCCNNIYYPIGGTLDFVAYTVSNPAHRPDITYTPDPASAPLLDTERFSAFTLDFGNKLNGLDDVLFSDVIHDASCTGSIPNLQFNHLLSKVTFTFQGMTTEAELFFRVTKIVVRNVKRSGKVTITTTPTPGGSVCSVDNWVAGSKGSITLSNLHLIPSHDVGTDGGYVDIFVPTQTTDDIVYDLYYKFVNSTEDGVEQLSREMVFTDRELKTSPTHTLYPGKSTIYNVQITMLPSLQLHVDIVDTATGAIIDQWVNPDADEEGLNINM